MKRRWISFLPVCYIRSSPSKPGGPPGWRGPLQNGSIDARKTAQTSHSSIRSWRNHYPQVFFDSMGILWRTRRRQEEDNAVSRNIY
jgi:hypothetical protein